MNVRKQLAAYDTVPIDLWNAAVARDAFWEPLRQRCAEAASQSGWELANDGIEDKHTLFVRFIDGPDGEPKETETTPGHATLVHLRLATWAVPK